jgi:hypothetical protein
MVCKKPLRISQGILSDPQLAAFRKYLTSLATMQKATSHIASKVFGSSKPA